MSQLSPQNRGEREADDALTDVARAWAGTTVWPLGVGSGHLCALALPGAVCTFSHSLRSQKVDRDIALRRYIAHRTSREHTTRARPRLQVQYRCTDPFRISLLSTRDTRAQLAASGARTCAWAQRVHPKFVTTPRFAKAKFRHRQHSPPSLPFSPAAEASCLGPPTRGHKAPLLSSTRLRLPPTTVEGLP